MIPPLQRDALSLLADVCGESSDVRFGQLLAHLGVLCEDQTGQSIWDIEDEQMLAVLRRHLDELRGRTPDPLAQSQVKTGAA